MAHIVPPTCCKEERVPQIMLGLAHPDPKAFPLFLVAIWAAPCITCLFPVRGKEEKEEKKRKEKREGKEREKKGKEKKSREKNRTRRLDLYACSTGHRNSRCTCFLATLSLSRLPLESRGLSPTGPMSALVTWHLLACFSSLLVVLLSPSPPQSTCWDILPERPHCPEGWICRCPGNKVTGVC